jgi:two-component system, LuxR family, response regulator FixJ
VSAAPIVYVVDDDPEISNSLALLLSSVAIEAETYESADAFAADFHQSSDRPAMLLLDVRLPGTNGMLLLERLRAEHPSLPIVIITGHGDIDMAVRAMKLGAVDFITKPFASQRLLDLVQKVLPQAMQQSRIAQLKKDSALRLATLTTREREVFKRLISGESNKAIALGLGISIRTVESHRASIMQKTKATTFAELVHLALRPHGEVEPLA